MVHVDLYHHACDKLEEFKARAHKAEADSKRLAAELRDAQIGLELAASRAGETQLMRKMAAEELEAVRKGTRKRDEQLTHGGDQNWRAAQLSLEAERAQLEAERLRRRFDCAQNDLADEHAQRIRAEERAREVDAALRSLTALACSECRVRAEDMLATNDFYAVTRARENHRRSAGSRRVP